MSDVHIAEDVPHVDPVLETEARDYGWAPKEEFKGPADRWRPADEYVEWAKQTGRLPKSQFDEFRKQFPAIRQENQSLKAELADIKSTLNQFVEFSSKAEERAFNRARADLEAKIEQAAANADPAAAKAAMRELAELKPEAPKPEKKPDPTPQPAIDPEIQDWIGKSNWFRTDKTLNAYATDVYGDLERSKPGMSVAERLAETERQTRAKFPEKFGINPAREGVAAVAAPNGGAAPAKKNAKTYENLPAEAKKACDKFVATIKGYTREQYCKDYDWDN